MRTEVVVSDLAKVFIFRVLLIEYAVLAVIEIRTSKAVRAVSAVVKIGTRRASMALS